MLNINKFFNKIIFFFNKRDYRKFYFVIFLLSLASISEIFGISSIMPFISSVTDINIIRNNEIYLKLFDSFNFSNNFIILVIGISSILLLTFGSITKILSLRIMYIYGNKIGEKLIIKVFKYYINNDFKFLSQNSSSEISKIINQEIQRYIQNVFIPLIRLISSSIFLFFTFIILLLVNPIISFIVILVFSFLYSIIYISFRPKLLRNSKKVSSSNKERFRIVNESIRGIRETKIFQIENFYINQFSKFSKDVALSTASSQIISNAPKSLIELIVFGILISTVILLVYFGNIVEILPSFIIFVFVGYKILPSIQTIYNSLVQIRGNISSIEKISDILFDKIISNKTCINFFKKLELNKISFKYKNKIVFKNLNITLNTGNFIAIRGESGSGKTTLIDIISGLISPLKGEILIDGISAEKFNYVSYVPQDVHLLEGSIKNNIILFSEEEFNKKRFLKAIKLSCLEEFLNKPNFIEEFDIGENGNKLSGGQRQRIGIARAIYHDRPLLILDEATNALDEENKRKILFNLKSLSKNKLILSVTHDKENNEFFDKCYNLKNGKLLASTEK